MEEINIFTIFAVPKNNVKMIDYFYKGLIFAPVYACVVYAIIFIINWKHLHVSQRIFTYSLIAALCSLLLYQCIIMEDYESCKPLIFLNSFAGPALVILFFLFTYSQMQTKSIFRPRLLALYTVPFISFSLLAANFIFGAAGNKELEAIVYSVVHGTSDLETTPLIEFQYLLYRSILIFGSIAVAAYFLYKIKWYEKLAQKFIADSDSTVMPMSKQLILTFFLFGAVTLAQFIKKFLPEEYYIIGAEIYGVFLVGLIVHTCRAVHHGYTRMPLEGEEVEQLDAEMQFLYDSFDEKTWSLASGQKANAIKEDAAPPAQKAEEMPSPEVQTPQEQPVDSQDTAAEASASTPSVLDEEQSSSIVEECAKKVEPEEGEDADTSKRNVLEYVQSSEIEHELQRVMIVKRLYMQQNITIKEVANAIGTNHYYLSVYLNRVLQTSFSDYINHLRIEREVLPRMKKNPEISTKELIVAANFSHRTTFYRAFQKVMGVSFQDYKASLKA